MVGATQVMSSREVQAKMKIPNGAMIAAKTPGRSRCSGEPTKYFRVYGS